MGCGLRKRRLRDDGTAFLPVLVFLLGVLGAGDGPTEVSAQIAPDTVFTVFSSDTIPEFGAVGGVTADAYGYVYIADFRNSVWRLSPRGSLSKFADGFYGASGNAIGPKGFLFQASFNSNVISRVSRTGDVETYVEDGLQGPVGIAINPDGELFVVNCSGGYVSKVGVDQTVSVFAKDPRMACPNGITFDDRGDLYVVNFNHPAVLKITPDGTVSEFTTVPGAGGNGHITFARGTFFVTQLRGNKVFRVNRDGSYEVLAGTGASGESDGPGPSASFTQPNGITSTLGGRELWVNDLTVRRSVESPVPLVTMRKIRLVSLTDVLAGLDSGADLTEVVSVYEAYRESRSQEDTNAETVAVAYSWLSSQRVGQALELFRLNAESYPRNAAAVFNYGESFRYTGRSEEAAEQYRKVLDIQPEHSNAAARLREITNG